MTGTLTALRVRNASQEDLMPVIGMHRLRAAYIEIDPSLKDRLVTGWTDRDYRHVLDQLASAVADEEGT